VAEDLERAFDAARGCDLFVAAGTSLVVGPINEMLPLARSSGAHTAILTASETPFDDQSDWKIDGAVEEVLPAIAAELT
jgi:NAD-dependent deacetylase